jgi:hypothetical protein
MNWRFVNKKGNCSYEQILCLIRIYKKFRSGLMYPYINFDFQCLKGCLDLRNL